VGTWIDKCCFDQGREIRTIDVFYYNERDVEVMKRQIGKYVEQLEQWQTGRFVPTMTQVNDLYRFYRA